MKKFEIVNNRWIKQIDLSINPNSYSFNAIRINDVSFISGSVELIGTSNYYILIYTSGGKLFFQYESSEEKQYKEDLIFFEKLLIQ